MDDSVKYHHAIKTVPENCDGCMNCLPTCPSHALRIRYESPIIEEEKCIDCGACIASCGRKAILPDVDRFKMDDRFKYWIAVPSPVVYSQFGLDTRMKEIHLGLHKLGFHYIKDVFAACRIQVVAIQEHLARNDYPNRGPLISSMCPAVVRLIQVKFPSLTKNIIPFEPPREISAREAKLKVARMHNTNVEDVGAVYISPCPAKNISVVQPADKVNSFLDGVVAISDIYKPLRGAIKKIQPKELDTFPENDCMFTSRWEHTGLMCRAMKIKNWIAVSGLSHVMDILDSIEKGKLDNVSFVEANACVEGCVGGSLCVESIYIAHSKTQILERNHKRTSKPDRSLVRQLYNSGYFFTKNGLKPRKHSAKSLSIEEAILLMKQRDALTHKLPGLNCCACGAPTCETFAEDVLLKKCKLDLCPYLGDELKEDQAQ